MARIQLAPLASWPELANYGEPELSSPQDPPLQRGTLRSLIQYSLSNYTRDASSLNAGQHLSCFVVHARAYTAV